MVTSNERRMNILFVLLERRFDTVNNLSIEFDVSVATIMRDIQELSRSHPIITKQGTGGGIYVADGYRLGRKYLTSKQTTLLEKLSQNLEGEDLATMKEILCMFRQPVMG